MKQFIFKCILSTRARGEEKFPNLHGTGRVPHNTMGTGEGLKFCSDEHPCEGVSRKVAFHS